MNYQLLIELHKNNPRQGPGGDAQTERALQLSGLLESKSGLLEIADVGCGTGASALKLAEKLKAHVTCVDLFSEFLDVLNQKARERGLFEKIETLQCSMQELPFKENSLDALWAEGSIYNMGFARGVEHFKRFLKPGGVLAASEITWLTSTRPKEIEAHWSIEYSEIAMASEKINLLEQNDFELLGYFPLPQQCWTENYYNPIEARFEEFLKKNKSAEAEAIVAAERAEIDLYTRFHKFYSYGFYVARKLDERI